MTDVNCRLVGAWTSGSTVRTNTAVKLPECYFFLCVCKLGCDLCEAEAAFVVT